VWLFGLNDFVAHLNMKELTAKRRILYRHSKDVDIIVINCFKDETQNFSVFRRDCQVSKDNY